MRDWGTGRQAPEKDRRDEREKKNVKRLMLEALTRDGHVDLTDLGDNVEEIEVVRKLHLNESNSDLEQLQFQIPEI